MISCSIDLEYSAFYEEVGIDMNADPNNSFEEITSTACSNIFEA